MTRDERRSAALLFSEELALGRVTMEQLDRPEVTAAVRERPIPSPLARMVQRFAVKRGSLTFAGDSVAPMLKARAAVLGADAAGPPRFLVRVDEFPQAYAWDDPDRYGTPGFARFHEILTEHEVPYLVAALPHVPRSFLDPTETEWRHLDLDEIALLERLRDEPHVSFGLHGLDHRTRFANPRKHSELGGRPIPELEERLWRGHAALAQHGIEPDVFVAPFNRFDASQYATLAARFEVVTGGPESIATMGWHPSPLWRGDAVFLPAYAPLYEHARVVAPAAAQLIEQQAGLWIHVVLHWGWESDDGWDDLIALCRVLRGYARSWEEFLAAVRASKVL
jgi:hypothetical protein